MDKGAAQPVLPAPRHATNPREASPIPLLAPKTESSPYPMGEDVPPTSRRHLFAPGQAVKRFLRIPIRLGVGGWA